MMWLGVIGIFALASAEVRHDIRWADFFDITCETSGSYRQHPGRGFNIFSLEKDEVSNSDVYEAKTKIFGMNWFDLGSFRNGKGKGHKKHNKKRNHHKKHHRNRHNGDNGKLVSGDDCGADDSSEEENETTTAQTTTTTLADSR